jgi:uncharacterized protein YdhG (YjbR/CyaY superfamily)
MKKRKSLNPGPKVKARAVARTVDEYLAGLPEPARSNLGKMRAAIQSAVPPQATETISYGMPAFEYRGILVWFAAFSDHCSFFPTAGIIEEFASDLKSFTTSKGTVRFALNRPLPAVLVRKMVRARVAQVEKKRTAESKGK